MSGIVNQAGVDSGRIGGTQALVTAAGESGGGGGSATHTAIADGALANGDRVILQADGKVKVIGQSAGTGAETITTDNQAQSMGARWEEPTIQYDPNDVTRFAVIYRVWTVGTVMRVGQITGTTISFGADQVVDTYNTNGGQHFQWHPKIANHIVAVYGNDESNGGWKLKVGEVTGTSINFSGLYSASLNPTNQDGGDYNNDSYFHLDCDGASAEADHNWFACICHRSTGGMDSYWLEQVVGIISDDGTTGEISDIHTVSGNEMAMGFNPNKHCVRFDPLTTKKYGLFWHDWEDNNKPKIRMNTVDGEAGADNITITEGSDNVVDNDSGDDYKNFVWMTGGGKVVCSWRKAYYPTLVIGTVTGTSVSFGSTLQIDNQQNPTWDIYITENSSTRIYAVGKTASGPGDILGKVVDVNGTTMTVGNTSTIMGNCQGGTNKGFGTFDGSNKIMVRCLQGNNASDYTKFTSATIGAAGSSNLAAGNFIGISDGAYADGVTATIQLSSPSIDDAQSGLTPGSSYYVQSDGSLSTTAGDPAVLAGIALSATQLLIKG